MEGGYDSSNAFASALAFRGVTSIDPGESIVFIEGNTSGTTDAAGQASFINSWFGGSAPLGFTIGGYGGSGIGLGTGGDGINIFDSTGTPQASVSFGAATDGVTFDNSALVNNGMISQLSIVGTNGAFASSIGEVGSPGKVIPEPGTGFIFDLRDWSATRSAPSALLRSDCSGAVIYSLIVRRGDLSGDHRLSVPF